MSQDIDTTTTTKRKQNDIDIDTIDEKDDDNLLDKMLDIDNCVVYSPHLSFNCGDLEKRRILLFDNTSEILWVTPQSSKRKVFISLLVKRVSAIDNVYEQYRMKFVIIFNWIISEIEYKSYFNAFKLNNLYQWKPSFIPRLEFENEIECHSRKYIEYDPPSIGQFKLINYNQHNAHMSSNLINNNTNLKLIQCQLECDITFSEELELQSFPFDCQDLTCSIREDQNVEFLPELKLNKLYFAKIDPKYSIIDEWDLESALLEFGEFCDNENNENNHGKYSRIVLRLKMKRRYFAILLNIVIPMAFICGLSLTSFSLHAENELGDRLNLLITLILTIVAFQYIVFEKLPNVAYLTFIDKYVLASYAFLGVIMIENSLGRVIGDYLDKLIFFKLSVLMYTAMQLLFSGYAVYVRQDEVRKLGMSSDEIEDEVNFSREMLKFDYTKAVQNRTDDKNAMKYAFTALAPKKPHEQTSNWFYFF